MCRTHLLSVDRKRLQALQSRYDRTLGPQCQTCHDLPISQTVPNLYLQYHQYRKYPISSTWPVAGRTPGPEAQSFALGIISTSRARRAWGWEWLGWTWGDYRMQPGDVVQQSRQTRKNLFLESTNNFLNSKWFMSMSGWTHTDKARTKTH